MPGWPGNSPDFPVVSEVDKHPQREFRSRKAVRRWLEANFDKADSFWLVTYKKHVAKYYVPYDEIVEELLCFGWIDTRTRRVDDDRTSLLVAARKPGSTWSASNKRRVARLTKAGLMIPAGQAKVGAAKADGSWTFMDDIEKLVVPDDLAQALARNRAAKCNFEAFPGSARKVILLWIKTARRETTREYRIAETVRLAAKNLKAAHPEAAGR